MQLIQIQRSLIGHKQSLHVFFFDYLVDLEIEASHRSNQIFLYLRFYFTIDVE